MFAMKEAEMNEAPTPPRHSSWRLSFLFCYLAFGALHELSHLLAARYRGHHVSFHSLQDLSAFLLGRTCSIPSLEEADELDVSLVRHFGWIFSVFLVLLVSMTSALFDRRRFDEIDNRNLRSSRSPWVWAATVTALEALSTDLFGFSFVNKTTFLCGNFGVILLNDGWTTAPDDHGKTALDLLEKMIEITMMRGAQTGGVVAWTGVKGGAKTKEPTPVRVRVVNGKRTDLSELLRKQLNRKLCSGQKLDPSIRCFLGHTRFATSSKATMDGTHPHQWSPAGPRSIYLFDDSSLCLSPNPKPVTQMVSNYITHNGDLDFFKIHGVHVDLEAVQDWLAKGTGHPMPAPVDSAAIAGLVDLIRCGGCFALSIRFARLIACKSASVSSSLPYPSFSDYEKFGRFFETSLPDYCKAKHVNLRKMKNDPKLRKSFVEFMVQKIRKEFNLKNSAFEEFCHGQETDIERSALDEFASRYSLMELVTKTVDAFFDNDLFFTTKFFLKNAVGSFGLMITSSIDAKRQICIAARGQPMSVAFYPQKGLVCYGSELAAVKAGMMFDNPAGNRPLDRSSSSTFKLTDDDMTQETCRFDLDDLGGEVLLLDFGGGNEPKVTTYQESFTSGHDLRNRITPLHKNEFLIPLTPDAEDPILDDIQTIPRSLEHIQNQWKQGGLNRLTAWNLGRKLQKRLQEKVKGNDNGSSIDLLVTGCEVSLYLAEQFASDLQKSFPKLRVAAISSNKILGVFGQELSVPSIGFPLSDKLPDLKKSIVLICSHSGGTFAPLAISNLLQSVTHDIFVVQSEWDTQIGKQLRGIFTQDKDIFGSRVFTTDIGVRPSEPCSLSVCATHQLLTQIFEHICLVILSVHEFRAITGAVITEQDLRVLERCNIDNIFALERIIGYTAAGTPHETEVNNELKNAGNLWADHVLENARAYILSFLYIVGTVTAGYPLVTGIAIASGLSSEWLYITRFFDSLIYFFLPQINVTLIRLFQGRNIRHRMTGRTVVIGDVPWVSQCADAFLSKIFARSFSIAGLNVLSGNPNDHLVHRHTHRVVRGTLLICGRPDGRLTALTSAECSVNLSVNQASSIQSLGGTCESMTIGHNPSKLQLTKMDIALGTHRPKFLCETILDSVDEEMARKQHALAAKVNSGNEPVKKGGGFIRRLMRVKAFSDAGTDDQSALNRSSHSLKGAYLGLQEKSDRHVSMEETARTGGSIRGVDSGGSSSENAEIMDTSAIFHSNKKLESKKERILSTMILERSKSMELRRLFERIDTDGSGTIDLKEFIAAYLEVNPGLSVEEITALFHEADVDNSGELDYEEFEASMMLDGASVIRKLLHSSLRNDKGLLTVEPSTEDYFGAEMYASKPGFSAFAQAHSQHFSMELYESRIASMQRFVAMTVMFHQMGKKVQDFFPKYSFGMFGYKMNRTHSIMRIATTASPVSGDAVRDQMEQLRIKAAFQNAVHMIMNSWNRRQNRIIQEIKELHMSSRSLNSSRRSFNPASNNLNGSLSNFDGNISATSVEVMGKGTSTHESSRNLNSSKRSLEAPSNSSNGGTASLLDKLPDEETIKNDEKQSKKKKEKAKAKLTNTETKKSKKKSAKPKSAPNLMEEIGKTPVEINETKKCLVVKPRSTTNVMVEENSNPSAQKSPKKPKKKLSKVKSNTKRTDEEAS